MGNKKSQLNPVESKQTDPIKDLISIENTFDRLKKQFNTSKEKEENELGKKLTTIERYKLYSKTMDTQLNEDIQSINKNKNELIYTYMASPIMYMNYYVLKSNMLNDLIAENEKSTPPPMNN